MPQLCSVHLPLVWITVYISRFQNHFYSRKDTVQQTLLPSVSLGENTVIRARLAMRSLGMQIHLLSPEASSPSVHMENKRSLKHRTQICDVCFFRELTLENI